MIEKLLQLDTTQLIAVVITAAMLSGLIGAFLGSLRNRMGLGAWLGMGLGPIGWLALFLIRPDYIPCPECKALVHFKWARCRTCKADLQRALNRSANAEKRAARAKWR